MSFLSEPVQNILVINKRYIDSIRVQVVVSEQTTDTLTVTKQPVQQGAAITDHAYMEPTVFAHSIYFQDNLTLSLSKIYQQLLTLQQSANPFNIVTPKRIYRDMLMTTLSQTTDKLTENCLAIHASYQQIILVPLSVAIVPRSVQKTPAKTGGTQSGGPKSAGFVAAGNQSLSDIVSKATGQ